MNPITKSTSICDRQQGINHLLVQEQANHSRFNHHKQPPNERPNVSALVSFGQLPTLLLSLSHILLLSLSLSFSLSLDRSLSKGQSSNNKGNDTDIRLDTNVPNQVKRGR
jgi:hypothetical protein